MSKPNIIPKQNKVVETPPAESLRRRYEVMRAECDLERQSFFPQWRDLTENISPRRGRFFITDVNRGDRRNHKIIDTSPTMAFRTLRSGMMSGVTSPARPWFKLTVPDSSTANKSAVKEWLGKVSDAMTQVFLRSNLYNVLPTVYGDMGTLATGCMLVEEDFDDLVRFYSIPIGSYFLAQNDKGKIDTFIRDMTMTVRQLIKKFGKKDKKGRVTNWENFSSNVRALYEDGKLEIRLQICHVIAPNESFDPNRMESHFKKFESVYFERGMSAFPNSSINSDDQQKLLRKSGYDYFPVLAPRWEVTGEDVYGTNCPGMEAIGDIKQLYQGERMIARAIQTMVTPPMVASSELKNSRTSQIPGDVTYVAGTGSQAPEYKPAYQIEPNVKELEAKQAQIRERISRAAYEDLFLAISQDSRDERATAREIDEVHEEKLLALGPVLEQLNQDLLDPLIDITFNFMMERKGMVPPPPPELRGQTLQVEYLSIMAQAQKLVGVSGIERFTGQLTQMATIIPGVLDKFDSDNWVDYYGDMLSVPPELIKSTDDAQARRQQVAQAQAAQQKQEQLLQASQTAKNLAQAPMDQDSALSRLSQSANAGQMAGMGAPGGR